MTKFQYAYCIEDDCPNMASHERLSGMADDLVVVELVCSEHWPPADGQH